MLMRERPKEIMSFRLSASILCIALAGCSVGPEYARPNAPVPAAFSERADASAAWPSAEWWRGFGSSELDQYMGEARQANYDLAAALARVREADALAKVAGAALLPSVNAGGAAVHERVLATSGSYQTVNLYGAQLSASYEIDFWGRNRAIRDAAAAAANASRYDRATVELIVMGVGLGLSLVCAVAKLHVGSLELADNHPGLRARMVLSSAA